MTYLLDTNVWIALLRGSRPSVTTRFGVVAPSNIRLCSMVAAELWYGCARSAKPAANRAAADILIGPYTWCPFDAAAADQFVTVRRHLESLGTPIGPYDLQIAAIALANGCTLVTHNTAEFSRVPGLVLENWETP